MLDYLACVLFNVLGAIFRILPIGVCLFLGRRLGDCFFYFDPRHKARSYANIKTALGDKLEPKQILRLTREFYQSFGQSIIEIFLIPIIDRKYLEKYVQTEGSEYVYSALKRGKGVILLSVHAGSWELSNLISANFGFPFVLFVKGQHFPRLNKLLNRYRQAKGCKIITREGGLKQLIDSLKSNSAVGITLDQGGRAGSLTDFFGQNASMSTGWIKLALKYDCSVIPVFFTRVSGPKIKVFAAKPLELIRSNDLEKDIQDNLNLATKVFEGFIRKYPKEYLWTYKIWKYSDQRNILILSDGKSGHLRQSEALAKIAGNCFKDKGIKSKVSIVEIKFKGRFSKVALSLSSCLIGKYSCQGCLRCLRKFLDDNTNKSLAVIKPDLVISCGSKLALINYLISAENQSKSVTLMRPPFFSAARFDLVVMPQHDHTFRRKNIVVTTAALNLIDREYLDEQSAKLMRSYNLNAQAIYLGILIGGSSKKFRLDKDLMVRVVREIKTVAEIINADILLTTSRRTEGELEDLIKKEFKDYSRAKLVVIANEKNIPEAVGGILGLSKIIISSPESISMISEGVNSARPVVVFNAPGLSRKHQEFLRNLAKKNYISLAEKDSLVKVVTDLWVDKPARHVLEDNALITKALERIL
ncbi:MAG: ELM1/GtrOC1 family putative glycosyltransferase [Candidatus Omnitrophica bacterium]|nr:ELM1/GtrOC1 family putative glycosyltransferase [Candidatus Omnitrophota bacterium]